MAGRCGKLKCCLTYELDHYLEALEDFPNELLTIETDKGQARQFKTDILQKKVWYSYSQSDGGRVFVLDLEDVKKFLNANKRGQRPSLDLYSEPEAKKENMMNVGELDQKFFTEKAPKKNRNNRNRRPNNNRSQDNKPQGNKPQSNKPAELKAQVANPQENRNQANKPQGNRPSERKPGENRPNRNRPPRKRPQVNKRPKEE